MASPPGVLQPPFYDPPITDYPSGQQHSQAWTEYHQSVADHLATMNVGANDGSDAAAGTVGEYMTNTSGAAGLVDNVVTNLAALNLTAGDWDVSGYVLFQAGSGSHAAFSVGIIGTDTILTATFPSTAITELLPTVVHRVNITVPTTVWVVGAAAFTGTVTATGTIRARRMR